MLIIDRFEGEYAIVETSSGEMRIPREDIPPAAREGDALRIELDATITEGRAQEMWDKLARLIQK